MSESANGQMGKSASLRICKSANGQNGEGDRVQVYEEALNFVVNVEEGLERGTMILRDCWGELLLSWPEVALAIEEGRWPVTEELSQLIQPQAVLLQAA